MNFRRFTVSVALGILWSPAFSSMISPTGATFEISFSGLVTDSNIVSPYADAEIGSTFFGSIEIEVGERTTVPSAPDQEAYLASFETTIVFREFIYKADETNRILEYDENPNLQFSIGDTQLDADNNGIQGTTTVADLLPNEFYFTYRRGGGSACDIDRTVCSPASTINLLIVGRTRSDFNNYPSFLVEGEIDTFLIEGVPFLDVPSPPTAFLLLTGMLMTRRGRKLFRLS